MNGRSARRGTIYEIAARAGVSLATVSRYLNGSGYVSAGAAERIATAVRELDYQPSQAARALAGRRSGFVVLCVPGFANPQWPEVAAALAARLAEHGLSLMLVDVAGGRERELAALDQVRRVRADGLAISMIGYQPGDFAALRRVGTKIVRLSRDIADASLDAVLPDRPGGIRLALRHLAELGHRRIALVHGQGGPVAHASRLEAYRVGREAAELLDEPELSIEVPEPSYAAGVRAAEALMESGASAAVESGDVLALGLWIGLERAGLAVPRDCSIVGMDDVEPAALMRGGLTTIALDRAERGRIVADLLLERINGGGPAGPRQVLIAPRLVVRASTAGVGGCAPGAGAVGAGEVPEVTGAGRRRRRTTKEGTVENVA
jgi:LacI family transcriptional regulator